MGEMSVLGGISLLCAAKQQQQTNRQISEAEKKPTLRAQSLIEPSKTQTNGPKNPLMTPSCLYVYACFRLCSDPLEFITSSEAAHNEVGDYLQ